MTRQSKRQLLKAATLGAVSLLADSSQSSLADEQGSDAPSTTTEPLVESSENTRRISVGVMGMNRGLALAKAFASQPNVEIRYVCDVDAQRLAAAVTTLQQERQQTPQAVTDFRQILDAPDVDVLVCAAPNHWHATATILACQAGKHVYVEKPASQTPEEGELMVRAATTHGRLVQVGMQRRSNSAWQDVIHQIHNGAIGEVFLARSWYANLRRTIGQDIDVSPPAALDYDLWQGPAPRRPYSPTVVPYNWHWRWHWGNGEVGNNGAHTLDLCRWGLNVGLPTETVSIGGRYWFDDAQETPDTNTVSFAFPGKKSATWECTSCNRHNHGFVTFYGSEGTIEIDDDASHRLYDRSDKLMEEHAGSPYSLRDHIQNFLTAIRSDSSLDSLNANVRIGHESALLCHLANIAYRMKRHLRTDPASGKILGDAGAMRLWSRAYEPGWQPRA